MLETLRFRDMNQYFSRLLLNGVILLLVWCGCVLAQEMPSDKLSVFAAASLKPSLDKIAPLFEKKYGVKLVLSFAGSGALARQIEYGAPADVFISANEVWLHHLENTGLIRDSTAPFSNALVLIENSKNEIESPFAATREGVISRLDKGIIALGNTSSVPAGIYAKAALEKAGLWKDIQSKVAQTDTVRAALRLVELGEARMAVVYASDVVDVSGIRVLHEFQNLTHPKIIYSGGRLRRSTNEYANLFLTFLKRQTILKLFYERGFIPLNCVSLGC